MPGIVAMPVALLPQSAGGESALAAVIAWWALGAVGCLVAGARIGSRAAAGKVGDAFMEGFAGVATAWVAAVVLAMVIEATVRVLHIGAVSLLIPLPFVIGYGIGFGLARLAHRVA